MNDVTGRESVGRYGWYLLALMTAAHILGYMDRWIMTLLIQPIKADLHLSDFQIGLLLGPAFGILFIVTGVPFGWLADRVNRPRLLAGGIALWCLFTAGSCLARDFGTLFAMRLGVGIGEAVLAPCAFSLIADYFPIHERPRAISVFMAGTYLGAGSAFLIGGPLITYLQKLPSITLPWFGAIHPWQGAFLGVGLPGLLVAALVLFTIREPVRLDIVRIDPSGSGHGLTMAARFFCARWQTYGAICVGAIGNIVIGSNAQWVTPLFKRAWNWDIAAVAQATGLLFLIVGPLGTATSIWIVGRLGRAGKLDAAPRSLLLGVVIVAVSFTLLPLAPAPALGLGILAAAMFGQSIATAAGPTAIIGIAPGNIRAQLMTFYYLANGLIAQIIGAPLVGALADHMKRQNGLGQAITMVSAVVGVVAVALVALGLRPYRASAIEMATLNRLSPATGV